MGWMRARMFPSISLNQAALLFFRRAMPFLDLEVLQRRTNLRPRRAIGNPGDIAAEFLCEREDPDRCGF
jgi:hypothetical protein